MNEATPAAPLQLSVVIPAYLEEENLRDILPRLRDVLQASGLTHEVLIVDAINPIDATAEVCSSIGPPIRYINRTGGNNFGDAKRTGIREAKGHWILFMDGDGSHSPEVIPRLLAHKDEAELVVASRYVGGGATENPRSLVIMSRVLNYVYALVLGIQCHDVSNSFKLYLAAPLKSIELRCDHFDIVEEIFIKYCAVLSKPRVIEVPFVFKKRRFGETKRSLLKFMFSFAFTLARLFFYRLSIRKARKAG